MERYFPPGRTNLVLFPLEHISHQELLEKMLRDRDEVALLMYLSMLSPRVGGGGGAGRADPVDFDIFMEAKVKFPTPGHLGNVKFPPLRDFVLLATCLKVVKFPTQGQRSTVKIPTQGKAG